MATVNVMAKVGYYKVELGVGNVLVSSLLTGVTFRCNIHFAIPSLP